MSKTQQESGLKQGSVFDKVCFAYLEEQDSVWDSKTYKSESSKAKTVARAVDKSGFVGNEFYKELKKLGYKPYTIKSLVQTASRIYAFGQDAGMLNKFNNPFKDFLIKSPQVFRNAYKSERITVTFDEVKSRLQLAQADEETKKFIIALLDSGLRIDEAYKVNHATSSVIGKGNKERFVVFNYCPPTTPAAKLPSQWKVRQVLKSCGLKPHTLRKVLATKLSRDSDFSHKDIMQIFGWNSIETASKYFQSQTEEELKAKLLKATK